VTGLDILAMLFVAGGIGLVAIALWQRDARRVVDLRQELELTYLDDAPKDAAEGSSLLARSGVIAERALAGTSLLGRLGEVVERSSWRVSPGELAVVSAVAGFGAFGLALLVGLPVFLAPLVGMIALGLPYLLCSSSVSKRTRAFEQQFPDILDLMSASLEAGAGVPQALELIVAEADDPAASEFSAVLATSRLGTPWVEALRAMAQRLGSRDVDWTVQAISVQQRTGGRLAEVLRIVATTMRAREEIRRELQALTAEGRLSAYVLGGLPIAFGLFLEVAQPAYARPLFTTFLGLVMVGGAVLLNAAAFVWMRKIIKIEV
jgi:tight adherence protein B